MKVLVGAVVLGLLGVASPLAAQNAGKADPRAVEACQKATSTFVGIAKCLPDAHVSVVTLDAFSEIYPQEANDLKVTCMEINERLVGAAACVTEAIKSAIALKGQLPEGTDLADPLFDAVSDPDHLAKLQGAQAEARKSFPDQMMWGMTMYTPYKK